LIDGVSVVTGGGDTRENRVGPGAPPPRWAASAIGVDDAHIAASRNATPTLVIASSFVIYNDFDLKSEFCLSTKNVIGD
jgi:hypothetical protein